MEEEEEDVGTTMARNRLVAIRRAIEEHPENGVCYEDDRLTVERRQGEVFWTGKPIRILTPGRFRQSNTSR